MHGVVVLLAVVIKVDREECRVGVSLREDRLEESQEHVKLVRRAGGRTSDLDLTYLTLSVAGMTLFACCLHIDHPF